MGKQSLLYLSRVIPGPSGGGTEMRAANHILLLSEIFEVTLAILGDHGNEAEVRARLGDNVNQVCISTLVISRSFSRLMSRTRSFRLRMLRDVLRPTPRGLAQYRPAVAELARSLAGQHFDVVHCFRLNTGLLRLLKKHGVSFTRSTLDLDSYELHAELTSITTFRKLIGTKWIVVNWLNAKKWWITEALLIPHFTDGIVCSEPDRQRLRLRFPRTVWDVVLTSVSEPPQFTASGSDRFTFLFVGLLTYPPNWDAVLFFCEQVVPRLRREGKEFRVLIVGRARDDGLGRLAAIEEVQLVLDPTDLSPYYAQSDVAVVPIRGGGGTRVKIFEAFSYGISVVSTTIGAEGLEVTPGTDIVIADGAERSPTNAIEFGKTMLCDSHCRGGSRPMAH